MLNNWVCDVYGKLSLLNVFQECKSELSSSRKIHFKSATVNQPRQTYPIIVTANEIFLEDGPVSSAPGSAQRIISRPVLQLLLAGPRFHLVCGRHVHLLLETERHFRPTVVLPEADGDGASC